MYQYSTGYITNFDFDVFIEITFDIYENVKMDETIVALEDILVSMNGFMSLPISIHLTKAYYTYTQKHNTITLYIRTDKNIGNTIDMLQSGFGMCYDRRYILNEVEGLVDIELGIYDQHFNKIAIRNKTINTFEILINNKIHNIEISKNKDLLGYSGINNNYFPPSYNGYIQNADVNNRTFSASIFPNSYTQDAIKSTDIFVNDDDYQNIKIEL